MRIKITIIIILIGLVVGGVMAAGDWVRIQAREGVLVALGRSAQMGEP